jgi:hypothetical protein
MTGCRIGRVKMKNGGADVRIFRRPAQPETHSWSFHNPGGIVKITGDHPLTLERILFLLEAARNGAWLGDDV